MRKLLLLLPLTLGAAAPAQERAFYLPGFERLRVYGGYQVEVVSGPSRAVARGPAAALAQLQARVEAGVLVLGAQGLARSEGSDAVQVRVSVPALRSVRVSDGASVRVAALPGTQVDLALSGSGSLAVTGLAADALDVAQSGDGAVTLAGTAGRLRLRGAGTGSLDGRGFTAREASIVWQSSGNATLNVRYTAEVVAGFGSVDILGAPQCRVSGKGAVRCARGLPVR